MAQHFELCDSDGDGFITFSQFLRWVELCGLNPDDHIEVWFQRLDVGGEGAHVLYIVVVTLPLEMAYT